MRPIAIRETATGWLITQRSQVQILSARLAFEQLRAISASMRSELFMKRRPHSPSVRVVLLCGPLASLVSSFSDRDQGHAPRPEGRAGSLSVVVGPVKNTRRYLPIWTSSPVASTAESTGFRLT